MTESEAMEHRRGLLRKSINARRRQGQQARQAYDGSQSQGEGQ